MTKLQQELLTNATKYLNNGWSVIPLKDKQAYLKSWKQYQFLLPTKLELSNWFRKKKVTGIGIVTGELSNIVVIDVDPKNGGKFTNLEKYKTLTALSGNNGRHYYFHPNNNEDLKTSHFKGFDIQGNGAYIVAPPSIHPNGHKYEWLAETSKLSLKKFPKEFKKLLSKKPVKQTRQILIPKIKFKKSFKLIPKSIIKELNALPISNVISSAGINVPINNKSYVLIPCPFHNDRNPSFSVYTEKNYAKCFGCNETFNNIQFIQKYYSYSFPQACDYLFKKFGINYD